MTKTFSAVASRSDEIENMINHAANVCCEVIVTRKDCQKWQGEVTIVGDGRGDFGIVNDEHLFPDNPICMFFDDVIGVQIDSRYLEEEPTKRTSPDGKPFHNGYCWQNSGDSVTELGRCPNKECGKFWGASVKQLACDCGATVSLT